MRYAVICCALALSGCIVASTNYWLDPLGVQTQLKAEAEAVFAALQAYKQETGKFPRSLDVLVPRFLPRQPVPAIGIAVPWDLTTGEFSVRYATDPINMGCDTDTTCYAYLSKPKPVWTCSWAIRKGRVC